MYRNSKSESKCRSATPLKIENFVQKAYFLLSFSDPRKNHWTDIRETYEQLLPSEVLRSYILLLAASKINH